VGWPATTSGSPRPWPPCTWPSSPSSPSPRPHRSSASPSMSSNAKCITGSSPPEPAYTLKSLPPDERPRERLLKARPGSLSDGELLAIILRTGLVGEMVTELANDLLRQHGGFWGLQRASVEQLSQRRGLKGAKVAQLKAALEIGRRMREAAPDERPQVGSP